MLEVQPNWTMEYFTMEHKRARCNICGIKYRMFGTLVHFRDHIIGEHNEVYESNVCQEEFNWVWKIFYITKNNNAKCILCNTIHHVPTPALEQIKYHLMYKHHVDETNGRFIHNYVKDYFVEVNVFERKCLICGEIYGSHNSLNSLKHLIWHEIVEVFS